MFFQKQYPTHEAFYLALKAGDDAAFSTLMFKLEQPVAKLCRQYHLATPDETAVDVVQETCQAVFVNLGTGAYQFNKEKEASPLTYAISIARNKIATLKRMEGQLNLKEMPDDLVNIPDNPSITDFEKADAILKHLHTTMDEMSVRLIWLRNAEDKAYRDIVAEQLMPEFTHEVSLRNKMKKSWDKWMGLLKKDGFV
jgi:DNA-directed RNA polymerase specialized sigma24 family protein